MSRKFIVLDTEACPIDRNREGVDGSNMLAYDFGWTVADREGNIYERRSFANGGILLGEKEKMKSAYYANKLPLYWEMINSKEMQLTSYNKIFKALQEDIKTYGVKDIYAYNMWFDFKTTNKTAEWLTNGKYKRFFVGVEPCDIMKMVQDVVYNTPTYQKFCKENGYMTKHKTPRPQKKAETVYRYITNDTDFMESHTALADATIETVIATYCFAKHKKMRRYLFE